MRMSGPPASRDDDEAVATITAALDAGVTFLDTMNPAPTMVRAGFVKWS
jgi:aryl-alcohol dehydrogenase-like predicted oxidoreductase